QLESGGFRERAAELARIREQAQRELASAVEATAAAEEFRQAGASQNPHHAAWAQLLELGRTMALQDGSCPLCGSEITEGAYDNHITEALAEIERVNAQV